MKRLLFMTMLAASATGCVEGNNPVQLINPVPLSPSECGKQNTGAPAPYIGSLDYAASNHYYMSFGLFSPLDVEDESSSGTGFIGQEIVYNYESKGVKATFKEESLPVYLVVPAGANPTENFIVVDLIGAEARKKLDGLVPASPDSMTLLATFKIKGKLASGRSVETNEVTFPVELTRTEGCTEPASPAPPADAPCANPGQDGFGYQCL